MWWAHLDSNQGPTGYEPVALPSELWARKSVNACVERPSLGTPLRAICQARNRYRWVADQEDSIKYLSFRLRVG